MFDIKDKGMPTQGLSDHAYSHLFVRKDAVSHPFLGGDRGRQLKEDGQHQRICHVEHPRTEYRYSQDSER